MRRISITFTNEMYEFLKNISEKNEVSLNETCTKIIEDFKSNKESFEKKSMNELSLNTIEIKKLTLKVSDLEKNLTASLIIGRQILGESSTAGFFVKQQYKTGYEAELRDSTLNELKKYIDEKDKIFNEVLKKSGVI